MTSKFETKGINTDALILQEQKKSTKKSIFHPSRHVIGKFQILSLFKVNLSTSSSASHVAPFAPQALPKSNSTHTLKDTATASNPFVSIKTNSKELGNTCASRPKGNLFLSKTRKILHGFWTILKDQCSLALSSLPSIHSS